MTIGTVERDLATDTTTFTSDLAASWGTEFVFNLNALDLCEIQRALRYFAEKRNDHGLTVTHADKFADTLTEIITHRFENK